MATDKIYSQGEIVEAIKTKAASLNLDSFRVRVNRRDLPHLPPNILATFDDVTQAHILGPELWLLDLFGGGSFELTVSHAGDPNTALPGPLKLTYDTGNYPVKKPTYNEVITALSQPAWLGPTKMIFPRPPSAPPGLIQTVVGPNGAQVTQAPVAPLSNTSVGGSAAAPLTQVVSNSTNPVERQEANRLMQVSEHLERKERELFEKSMEIKMEAMRQPAPVAAPVERGPSMTEIIAGATPLIMAFLQSKDATDKMMFQAQQDAAARQIAMQQEASARQLEMMKMMMELNSKKPDESTHMKGMAEMLGTMANVSMQIIQSNAEMMAASQPQQEPPSYKLARQAMVALSAVMGKTQATLLPDDNEGGEVEAPALPAGSEPVQGRRKVSQLELLERDIRAKAPVEVVSARFVKTLKSKKFRAFLQAQYQNNFISLVEARLGQWAAAEAENLEYLQAILPKIWEAGQKAGLVPASPAPAEQPAPAPAPTPVEAAPVEAVPPAPTNGAAVAPERSPKKVKAASTPHPVA